MQCKYCNQQCIKKGFPNGKQNYRCKACKKYQQQQYQYKMCTAGHKELLVKYNNEGMSISSMARLTGISKANVVNIIRRLGRAIGASIADSPLQQYEIDEMSVTIGSKHMQPPVYLIYALNRFSKQVVGFFIGRRTKENISKVVDTVISFSPERIYTDKLPSYAKLLAEPIHVASSYNINHIERFNLTLRTHLKRLSRSTIFFSKSKEMLECSLKLYLFRNFQVI